MFKRILTGLTITGLLAFAPTPALAQPSFGLEIHIGTSSPPRVRHEVRPPRHVRGEIWIPGAWDWRGDQWVWIDGGWARPARPGAYWVRPRYAHEGDRWRYSPGHWSHQRVVEGSDYRQWKEERRERQHRAKIERTETRRRVKAERHDRGKSHGRGHGH